MCKFEEKIGNFEEMNKKHLFLRKSTTVKIIL